jgi:hypothetical protein
MIIHYFFLLSLIFCNVSNKATDDFIFFLGFLLDAVSFVRILFKLVMFW